MVSKFLLMTLSVTCILFESNVLGQCNTRPSPCQLTCRCNTTSCLPKHAMGCGNLGCQLGWSGPTCQKQNTAYTAWRVESSSELSVSNTDNLAVDGNLTSVFRSAVEANPYVTVSTAASSVQSVKIYNGAANLNDISGFEIYVSGSPDFINSKLCYKDSTNTGRSIYSINCKEPVFGRYVKLIVPKTTSLAISELEIYSCGVFWFGSECDRLCNCRSARRTCNGITGACLYGCPDGFNGTDCYTECPAGTWGTGCKRICHCKNVSSCNKVNGTCDGQGCDAGYKRDNCQYKCDRGTYGERCGKVCHCKSPSLCNNVNGSCGAVGCEAGYQGSSCDRECSAGRFGENCQYYCHCRNNTSCDRVHGTCDENGCAFGYEGDNCQETTASGSTQVPNITETGTGVYNQEEFIALLAGGGVLAGICFVLIVYVTIATFKGRQWYKRLQQEVKSRYASVELSKGGRNSKIYENAI